MKKLLLLAVIFTPSFAFAQSSGLAWTDGAVLTAQQLQNLDNSKINTSRIGAANGVAPLDANAMMSAAVSGDTSAAPATASGATSARTLSSHFGDIKNIKDYGVKLDGTDTAATINNAMASINGVVNIPDGTWPSTSLIPNAPSSSLVYFGDVKNWPTYYNNTHGEGVRIPYFGPGVTSVGFQDWQNNGLTVNRVDDVGTTATTGINARYNYVANNANTGTSWNSGHQNGTFNTFIRESNEGFTNNLSANTYIYSSNGGGNFDVGLFNKVIDYGQDWTWAQIDEYNDVSHIYCNAPDMLDPVTGSARCQRYLHEWDLNGYGKEAHDISYQTQFQSRDTILLSYGIEKPPAWSASTSYAKHSMILQTSDDVDYEYENESGGDCVSSTTTPAFAYDETSNITDGTCSWKFMGVGRYEVGSTFTVGGDNGSYLGTFLYFDGSAGAARISNSVFDLSHAVWDENNTTHTWARVQPDTYLDLTDDGLNNQSATDHGQNRHTFGYDSSTSALSYKVAGKAVVTSDDSGNISANGLSFPNSGQSLAINSWRNVIQSSGTNNISLVWADGLQVYVDGANQGTLATQATVTSAEGMLPTMTKAAILAITSPSEGQSVYDTDDHEQVTYRCPTTTTCGWFPVQYGTALSD